MRRIVLILGCVLLGAGIAGAQAGPGQKPVDPTYDAKVFNGNSCQPREGTEVADFRWFVRGIMNVSSEYREVSCPVGRDEALGLRDASFFLALRCDAGGEFCCTIYSFNQWGYEVVDSAEMCRTVEGFWFGGLGVVESSYLGYYGLHCNVPPGGWVMAYGLWEEGPTDDD